MASRKKRQVKYILISVFVGMLILLAIFSYTLNNKKSDFFSSLLKDGIVQVQRIVYYPFHGIVQFFTNFYELQMVLEENDILKANVEKSEYLQVENIELRKQIEQLKEELDIDYTLIDYEYLNATVVSRNTNYWFNTLTIDKGSYNGIEVDMVVINSSGLVGRVVEVSNFTSSVKLLTTSDTNNKISITITNGDNKVNGLINGYDYERNLLGVEGVSNTEVVSVGDYVYTSGLGGVFPSGILIGTVEAISVDSYGLAKVINVKPSGDFDDINYVTVLKRKDS